MTKIVDQKEGFNQKVNIHLQQQTYYFCKRGKERWTTIDFK